MFPLCSSFVCVCVCVRVCVCVCARAKQKMYSQKCVFTKKNKFVLFTRERRALDVKKKMEYKNTLVGEREEGSRLVGRWHVIQPYLQNI